MYRVQELLIHIFTFWNLSKYFRISVNVEWGERERGREWGRTVIMSKRKRKGREGSEDGREEREEGWEEREKESKGK